MESNRGVNGNKTSHLYWVFGSSFEMQREKQPLPSTNGFCYLEGEREGNSREPEAFITTK